MVIPIWLVLFKITGVYNLHAGSRLNSIWGITVKLLVDVFVGQLFIAAMLYYMQEQTLSRLFFIIFGVVNLILLIADKLLISIHRGSLQKSKLHCQRVLVVGTEARAKYFTDYIDRHPGLLIDIIGYVQVDDNNAIIDEKVLGNIKDLIKIIKENTVDEVVFALPRNYIGNIEETVLQCECMGITVHMVLDLYDLNIAKTDIDTIGTMPVLTFYTVEFSSFQLFLKRVLDITGAIVGLLITHIVCIFIAPAIP